MNYSSRKLSFLQFSYLYMSEYVVNSVIYAALTPERIRIVTNEANGHNLKFAAKSPKLLRLVKRKNRKMRP